jgi:hypothetical protein
MRLSGGKRPNGTAPVEVQDTKTKVFWLLLSTFVLWQPALIVWAQTDAANALDAANMVWTTGGTGSRQRIPAARAATGLAASSVSFYAKGQKRNTIQSTSSSLSSVNAGEVAVNGTTSGSVAATPVAADSQADAGAAGSPGQFVGAPPVIQSLAQQPDGSMELRASGGPGQTYLIQACETLDAWATIGTNHTGAKGTIVFLDPNAGKHPSRFYRLALP